VGAAAIEAFFDAASAISPNMPGLGTLGTDYDLGFTVLCYVMLVLIALKAG
jgi:hypothetical protein